MNDMHYDLVISDFDGTLLRNDDTISPRTLAAIRDYTAAGGIFGVSTGRAFASIRQRLGELGLRGAFPVMSCQGAFSRDSQSGEVISRIAMEKSAAVEFLRRAESLGLAAQFYTDDDIFAAELSERNRLYFERNRLLPRLVENVADAAQSCESPILKVLCLLLPSDRQRVLRAMEGIEHAKVFATHSMLIEAVADKAGKGNGLVSTCERLGISIARSVALGDELNDIDMIETAGLGVAMGNAVPEVKAIADYITDDCNNDGVAKLLERILRDEL